MALDILSEKGSQTLVDEAAAVSIFRSHCPNYFYFDTPKSEPAVVDAVMVMGGALSAVVETKCRYNLTEEKFWGKFEGTWLVTFDKLMRSRDIARALGVGLVGFLYLVDSKVLLVNRITDKDGVFPESMQKRRSPTPETINGGLVYRLNAFIDMTSAKAMR